MSTATTMLALYIEAEQDILQNGSSTAFKGRMLTMADLGQIQAGRREWQKKVDVENRDSTAPGLPHSLVNLTER